MALIRKLRVGDRFSFPASSHDPQRFPAFTGVVTETHANDGIVWYRDEATGQSSCFIAHFHDGTFNTLACHEEKKPTPPPHDKPICEADPAYASKCRCPKHEG